MLIIKGKKIEYMLKAYRKKVEQVKQLDEIRDRKYFEKPSEKKRRTKLKAKYLNSRGNNSKF